MTQRLPAALTGDNTTWRLPGKPGGGYAPGVRAVGEAVVYAAFRVAWAVLGAVPLPVLRATL